VMTPQAKKMDKDQGLVWDPSHLISIWTSMLNWISYQMMYKIQIYASFESTSAPKFSYLIQLLAGPIDSYFHVFAAEIMEICCRMHS
jgi:hypothetical protein